jgi:hypothetical protein
MVEEGKKPGDLVDSTGARLCSRKEPDPAQQARGVRREREPRRGEKGGLYRVEVWGLEASRNQ